MRSRLQLKPASVLAAKSLTRGSSAAVAIKPPTYADFARRGIPLGSGGVESAIRRVVNLRLKGPSIFWRKGNAECMLHLRSYLKAGRWDELMRRVMHRSPDGKPAASALSQAA